MIRDLDRYAIKNDSLVEDQRLIELDKELCEKLNWEKNKEIFGLQSSKTENEIDTVTCTSSYDTMDMSYSEKVKRKKYKCVKAKKKCKIVHIIESRDDIENQFDSILEKRTSFDFNESDTLNYYLNINGNYFKFVDVPGDGDCFYHSILKNSILSKRFGSVQEMKLFVKDTVLVQYRNDLLLRKIFLLENMDYKSWCSKMMNEGEWATTCEMMVFSYVLSFNIIIVGNYMNGFVMNDMQSCLSNALKIQKNVSENGTIFIYFHIYGKPLLRSRNGNHFAYLESVTELNFSVDVNTIQLIS